MPDPRPDPTSAPAPAGSLAERFGALRHLPALARLVYAASPRLLPVSFGLRLARASLPVLMLYVAKLILDAVVAEHGRPHGAGLGLDAWLTDPALRHLAGLVLLEFALAVLADLLGRASNLVDGLVADRYANAASLRLMRHAASLDLAQFEDAAGQDRLERARRQVTGRSNLLFQLFGQGQDLVTLVAFAIGLAAYAPWLILLVALALVPAFLNESYFNRQGYRLAWRRTPERRQIDYLRGLGAGVESAKEVKLFGLEDYIAGRYAVLGEKLIADNRDLALRRAAWGGGFAALGSLAYYVAYATLVWRTAAGQFSIGDLAFLAGSFQRLRGLIEGLLQGLSQIASGAQYLDDLFAFFALVPTIRSPPNPVPFPSPMAHGIVFEDVGFRYPGTDIWAVRGLSFHLRAGEVLALVGENGAGKTTLVKLLTRLYDPTEGRVLLDGRPLGDYDLDALRARIGVIFQDFVRFNLTAGQNVAVGRIGAAEDADRIVRSAERGLADAVIARLPLAYDQPLGKLFAEGVDLSGGQWQKIALSRAYMREAEILVLDEPTAALDARAEFEVFRRFRDLGRGRTALLISHRFSTVRMADRILVLEGGRVLESGTHAELQAAGGRYAELFELQAAGYR